MTEARADGNGADGAVVTTTKTDGTRADGSEADGGRADGIGGAGDDDTPLIEVVVGCACCTEVYEGIVPDIGTKGAGAGSGTLCHDNCGAAAVVTAGIGDRAN